MIWCVEDDASIRDIELYALRSAGLEAEGFTDGAAFWQALQSEKPDLVVLDVMLPGIDGTELLGRMRASTSLRHIPVIMATAKGAEYDRVRALDGGADDYLTKPFSVIELVSRVKAVLRRCQPEGDSSILRSGEVSLDTRAHTVLSGGERVDLTYKEYELLRLFLSHPGTAARSWARPAHTSPRSAAWATVGRRPYDKKDISLHRGGGACGAAGQSGHYHGRTVHLFRPCPGAAAPG